MMAFLTRYAHQDLFRLLGRDPMTQPLTALELAVFTRHLTDYVLSEVEARPAIGGLGGLG